MHSLSLLTVVVAARSAFAHMEMREPLAFRSRFGSGTQIDYSNTSPLLGDGSNFPCKGYHHDTGNMPVATYQAGDTVQLKLEGSATHGGGSCQVSLSYDGGNTFKVIMSMIGGCPLPKNYLVKIPHFAPQGEVVFAWSWFNLLGNREMYMNCALVNIKSGSGNSSDFENLPDMYVANVGNGKKTVEGSNTIFPRPGDNVLYGHGLGPASGDSSPAAIKASSSTAKASSFTEKASSSTAKASPATEKASPSTTKASSSTEKASSSTAVTSSPGAISIPPAWNTTLYNSTTSSHAPWPTAPCPTHNLNATTSTTPASSSYPIFIKQSGSDTTPLSSSSAASQHRPATTATLSGLSVSGTASGSGLQDSFSLRCSCSLV
ncbi:hypothetical protein GX48_06263 [Paracoccidioides brasiliensis]|nr:hypothetical protein GX48_06263 [Paracoccidioides brasiliensis]